MKNEICQVQNEASLQDILKKSKATASTTEHSCKTSSVFKVDNVKHQAILRDFLQKRILKAEKQSFSAKLSPNLVVES
jgi:hypothetical protein